MGKVAFSDFFPLCWGFLIMQGSRSISAVFCAPKKAGVRQPLLIFLPYGGDPRECRGDIAFPPSFGSPGPGLRQPFLILFLFVGDHF